MHRNQGLLKYSMDRKELDTMGWLCSLGSGFALVAILSEQLGAEQSDWWGFIGKALFALLFLLIGLLALLIRGGVTIDRKNGVVTSWWGLLKPHRIKTHSLAHFKSVLLIRKVQKSRSKEGKTVSKTVKYPIVLSREAIPRDLDAYRALYEIAGGLKRFMQRPGEVLEIFKRPVKTREVRENIKQYYRRVMQPGGSRASTLPVCAISDLATARSEAEKIAKLLNMGVTRPPRCLRQP